MHCQSFDQAARQNQRKAVKLFSIVRAFEDSFARHAIFNASQCHIENSSHSRSEKQGSRTGFNFACALLQILVSCGSTMK